MEISFISFWYISFWVKRKGCWIIYCGKMKEVFGDLGKGRKSFEEPFPNLFNNVLFMVVSDKFFLLYFLGLIFFSFCLIFSFPGINFLNLFSDCLMVYFHFFLDLARDHFFFCFFHFFFFYISLSCLSYYYCFPFSFIYDFFFWWLWPFYNYF